MATESKTVLYFKPEQSTDEELGAFDSMSEASAAMHEHHESLYRPGEEVPHLYPMGKFIGSEGDNFRAGSKGSYRIAQRRVKL